MARTASRPGRTLGFFGLGVVLLFGLVAIAGEWKPALGLDLQGGQRITLRAVDDDVSESALTEASKIINARVNGSGVTEAEVSTQGSTNIVVEVPGKSNQDLVETVQRQAQLRFRLVACSTANPGACAASGLPGQPNAAQPSPAAPSPAAPSPAEPRSANRPAPAGLVETGDTPAPAPTATPAPTSAATETPSPSATPGTPGGTDKVQEALGFMNSPSPEAITAYNQTTCPQAEAPRDDPDTFLVSCGDDGIKYLLSAAVVEGTQLKEANAGQDPQSIQWSVNLELKDRGTDAFAQVSQALVRTNQQFAIVLDGATISAPTMQAVITDGKASITGNFNEETATSLATSLKFGALPVRFEENPKNDTIGPSLAGNQLSAGIGAGAAGLGLVLLYCLLYYRGLGLVVMASLGAAAVITYGMVLLLGQAAGFTLSLPGIAGLIVAVGITADSFIVFFERIRDEMRDGKSMRIAVESGWERARNTCLAADAVALAAALVLYIFAIDDVRGFAFTLGLSTLIDLVVFFFFTKPMVSWLGHFAFFHTGHKLSGLDAENLGIDRLPGLRAGGVA